MQNQLPGFDVINRRDIYRGVGACAIYIRQNEINMNCCAKPWREHPACKSKGQAKVCVNKCHDRRANARVLHSCFVVIMFCVLTEWTDSHTYDEYHEYRLHQLPGKLEFAPSVDFFAEIILYESMVFRQSAVRGTGFKWRRFLKKALLGVLILSFFAFLPFAYVKIKGYYANDRRLLRDYFESGEFDAAYTQSGLMLMEKPLDSYLLTIHGFSAYQMAIAQINNFDTISYVDDCIWALRKALLPRDNSQDGRIFYVLGKAYYYKGSGYADLAVKYLEKAREASHRAADIPEYLGLSYAAIGDFRNSVAAFTLALTGEKEPSDVLLLSIAKSYLALGELDSAHAYLVHCLEISRDSKTIAAGRLLLGNTLVKFGDIPGAEAEYLKVVEENGDNAEAHFQLGELYALGGDTTRARAEWRRALRLDPTHGPARSRLN